MPVYIKTDAVKFLSLCGAVVAGRAEHEILNATMPKIYSERPSEKALHSKRYVLGRKALKVELVWTKAWSAALREKVDVPVYLIYPKVAPYRQPGHGPYHTRKERMWYRAQAAILLAMAFAGKATTSMLP